MEYISGFSNPKTCNFSNFTKFYDILLDKHQKVLNLNPSAEIQTFMTNSIHLHFKGQSNYIAVEKY